MNAIFVEIQSLFSVMTTELEALGLFNEALTLVDTPLSYMECIAVGFFGAALLAMINKKQFAWWLGLCSILSYTILFMKTHLALELLFQLVLLIAFLKLFPKWSSGAVVIKKKKKEEYLPFVVIVALTIYFGRHILDFAVYGVELLNSDFDFELEVPFLPNSYSSILFLAAFILFILSLKLASEGYLDWWYLFTLSSAIQSAFHYFMGFSKGFALLYGGAALLGVWGGSQWNESFRNKKSSSSAPFSLNHKE